MKEIRGKNFRCIAVVILFVIFTLGISSYLYALPVAKVSKDEMRRAVISYINGNMPWPKGAVRIEFSSGISDVSLPGRDITCRIQSGRDEDYIGNCNFTIRFYEGEVFLKKQTVRVRLEVHRDVVVASKYLDRGIEIGNGDVRLVKKWFDRIPTNIVAGTEEVVGKRLRVNVKQNAEITRNMVRNIPLVKRGKLVRIVIERMPLSITTIGLSEQDGMLGDLVKVKNASSRRTIYARVMGDSLVRVEF